MINSAGRVCNVTHVSEIAVAELAYHSLLARYSGPAVAQTDPISC